MDYIITRSDGSEALYHHGIKGQKWGVRKYQNPDGTLTEAGKKRYEKIDYKINQIKRKQKLNEGLKKTYSTSLTSDYKSRVDKIKSKGYNVAKEKKKIDNAHDRMILTKMMNESKVNITNTYNQRKIDKLLAKKDKSYKKDSEYIKTKKKVGKMNFNSYVLGNPMYNVKVEMLKELGYKSNPMSFKNPGTIKTLRNSKNYKELSKKYG